MIIRRYFGKYPAMGSEEDEAEILFSVTIINRTQLSPLPLGLGCSRKCRL